MRLQPDVQLARGDHLLHELGRHGLAGLVVAGEPAQDRWLPGPVLHDLGRRLHEVDLGLPAADPRVRRPGEGHVEDVAELVEQGLELVVLDQRGAVAGWWREVGEDRADRPLVAFRRRGDGRRPAGTPRRGRTCPRAGTSRRRSGRSALRWPGPRSRTARPMDARPGRRGRGGSRDRTPRPVSSNMPARHASMGRYSATRLASTPYSARRICSS